MSSLKDLASLIMIPSLYKDGELHTVKPLADENIIVHPDATDNNDGVDGSTPSTSSNFTFSRGSNLAATRVDVNGLIEKGRENVLLQSNQFDTTWFNSNSTETGGQAGYDGSNDAWRIDLTGAAGYISQSLSQAGIQTASVYAKAGTLNFVRFRITGSGADKLVDVNLTNGSIGTTGGGNIDSQAVSIGNGWYRISLSCNTTPSAFLLYPIQADSDFTATSGNIYIQDAQVELGLVATDYIETTTTSVSAGILEDMPRLDYSGGASCPSLLLEPQRSNLVQYSEYFADSNWQQYIYGGASLARDFGYASPEGKNNAYRFSYTAGSGSNGMLLTDNFIATASVDYTLSVWMKGAVGGEKVRLCLMDTGSNGVAGTTFTLTDEWVLYTDTITNSAGTSRGFQFRMQNVIGVDNDQVVYVYGAQAEVGSYPTSYIPTYGTSQTRSADSCLATSVSDVIGQTEGTMFVEASALSNESTNKRISLSDGTNANRVTLNFGLDVIGFVVVVNNVASVSTSHTISPNTNHKIAFAYKENDFVAYIDGTQVITDTSGSTFSGALNSFRFSDGQAGLSLFAGNTKQTALFNKRLSNAELAALTTL